MADRTLNDDDRAELVAYLDGELEGAGRERVEARLRTDPQLRIEADTYQQTWALLDRLPQPAPSPNFASRTLEQVAALGQSQETVGRRWPMARSLAWAAGTLFVAGLAYAVTPNKKLDVDLDSDSGLQDRTARDRKLAALFGGREYGVSAILGFDRSLWRGCGGTLMATRIPMIGLVLAGGFAVIAAARGPAADATVRNSDPETRARLQRNLAAFHRLSPAMQAKVRQLDRALFDEDAITRQRLFGVMHRYAGWLSRLSADDRSAIVDTSAGPNRLQMVRSTLDRQWLASLTKTQRAELDAKPAEQAAMIEKWKS